MEKKRLNESVALPNWVKSQLAYYGLTVRGLARKYGVSPTTVAKLLSGKARFERLRKSHELLHAIAGDYPYLVPIFRKLYPQLFSKG